jgi:heme-degrading monooxygenase HmoA
MAEADDFTVHATPIVRSVSLGFSVAMRRWRTGSAGCEEPKMWARVSTYEGPPENIDEDLRYSEETILPQVRQLAGFDGVYSLADRQTGRTMSITFWDSEADMWASETDADRLREDGTAHVGGTILSVERFEVTYQELAATSPPAPAAPA